MPRAAKLVAILLSIVTLVIVSLLPEAVRQTAPAPATIARGAFHIHSDRSDGSGSVDAIAAAAARAGLQFIILTDHGDGTRSPDAPVYRSGVLTIDGVELSTTGGHYAAIDLPASPYPIAGTPDDVIEDVDRLGGFGIAAHPGSPRPSLSWQAWDAPFDGLEWINGDSEWRDEPRLPIVRALLTYLVRPPPSLGTLLDRPENVLSRWDGITQTRKIVGLAGTDAHARLGFRQRTDPDAASLHVRLPGYEVSFRSMSNHVVLDAPLSGDAATDARVLVDAIRAGRVYSVIDALASPGSLSFGATSGSQSVGIGEALELEGDVVVRASVNAPPNTRLVLIRNGTPMHEAVDAPLEVNGGRLPAVYRVEAYTAGAPGEPTVPWIVSNPIYAGLASRSPDVSATPEHVVRILARTSEAAAEAGPNDTSAVRTATSTVPKVGTTPGEPTVEWSFGLSPGVAAGQFAAVQVPVSAGLGAFDRVTFRVVASGPMRIWVQLRASIDRSERWGRTVFVDRESRLVDLALASFRPIGATTSERPPLDRVDSLLFVADTLNTLPGSKGSATLSEIGFVK